MYYLIFCLLWTVFAHGIASATPFHEEDNSVTGALSAAAADVRDVIFEEKNASRHQIHQIGIDAPYIFLHHNNQTRPRNFPFGEDLFSSLLHAMMPANSSADPSFDGIAKSPEQLQPDVLLNQLLSALIPVLGAPHQNEVNRRNVTVRHHNRFNTTRLHLQGHI